MIHGRVQGVFFRDTLRRMAQSRGVAGWARNRDDGTVEALVEFCREGPERARVDGVDVSEQEPEGAEGFRIV